MKATYRIKVKQACRSRLRHFIRQHFSETKLRTARVLCFPGREALEILEVFAPLGIPIRNIVCLEHSREVFRELRRRPLGVDLRQQTLADFLEEPCQASFDIVSLDFNSQLGTQVRLLERLRERALWDDDAIIFTNFCGAREADASKGYYYFSDARRTKLETVLRRTSSSQTDAQKCGWRAPLAELRSSAVHDTVRSTLTDCFPVMAEMLFRERYPRGGWDRRLQAFVNTFHRSMTELGHPEFARVPKQLLEAARRRGHIAPAPVISMLNREARARVRNPLRRFSRQIKACGFTLTGAANLLALCLDIVLSRPATVVAAQSFRYVSDGGTPMYGDIFRLKRISDYDFLGDEFQLGARSLAAFLAPVRKMSPEKFESLLRTVCHRSRACTESMAGSEPPERENLGSERLLYRRPRHRKLDM